MQVDLNIKNDITMNLNTRKINFPCSVLSYNNETCVVTWKICHVMK